MTPAEVGERVERIVAARRSTVGSRDELADALRATEQSISWLEAQRAGLIRQLSQVDSFPEKTIADTSRCGLGRAHTTKERADTLGDAPTLADALEEGAITVGHVDAVTRGGKRLDNADQRAEFIDRVGSLANVAAADTIEQFSKRLDLEIKKIQRDDGEDRLTRQRKATRLSSWVDVEGMWNLRGRFDPVTGVKLSAKLDQAVEALFAQRTPEHCPKDPIEKQRFLEAHALTHLLNQGGAGATKPGRPEFVVVIDTSPDPTEGAGTAVDLATCVGAAASGPSSDPSVEFAIPVEIPPRILAEIAGDADVHAVVVCKGVVLHAPGRVDLGRSTRLANRHQRRALRALYRCCSVPGCSVPFDRLKIHHVVWWRHGGHTDLENLLPVCSKHHSAIHNDGWIVTLGPNRQLDITLPDGRVMATGPPRRSAA